ncbi:MAG TPA: aromatic ring-hydroxylating dioxygenase subunit alpha [Acidimicrobiales bacterium]|nr:aromatic ring-hydroxylating dioxygenase subunit alpha [Acidimicrobiales bacterium]
MTIVDRAGVRAGGHWIEEDAGEPTFRVHRSAFRSQAVFDAEMQQLWGHQWLYLAHQSEIPERGDYKTRIVGGRDLLVVRDEQGEIRVYFNSCPHRGTVLARQCEGNARYFKCFYHAWSFSNSGQLVSLPDEGAYPPGEAFKARSGLRTVPLVENFRGFIFVCFDPAAAPLADHLGVAGDYIAMVAEHCAEGMEVLPGTQRYSVRGNWKLAVENAMDGYHFGPTHATFVAWLRETGFTTTDEGGKAVVLGGGHSVLVQSGHSGRVGLQWEPRFGDEERARTDTNRQELFARVGEERGRRIAETSRILYVFPNLLLFDIEALSIRQLEPVSPGRTDVRAWELAPVGEPASARELRLKMLVSFVGPGGLATPDDIEAYEAIQRGVEATAGDERPGVDWNDISRGLADELAGLPHDEILGGTVSRSIDESAIRSFWRQWHTAVGSAVAR